MSDPTPTFETELQKNILNRLLTRVPSDAEARNIRYLEFESSEHWALETPHSDLWSSRNVPEADKILQEKLNGKPLLDLGGAAGLIRGILKRKEISVSKYINVDKFFFTRSDTGPGNWETLLNEKTPQGFRFSERNDEIRVSAGMLDFLQYAADGSVDAISINGIDMEIIDDLNYHKELANQIRRVLKPAGVVFGYNSKVLTILMKDSAIEKRFEENGSMGDWFILEKRKGKVDNL